jgi:hypothetical protein
MELAKAKKELTNALADKCLETAKRLANTIESQKDEKINEKLNDVLTKACTLDMAFGAILILTDIKMTAPVWNYLSREDLDRQPDDQMGWVKEKVNRNSIDSVVIAIAVAPSMKDDAPDDQPVAQLTMSLDLPVEFRAAAMAEKEEWEYRENKKENEEAAD